jgi:hypothetical protein
MPSPLSNPSGWTLRRLLTNTYFHAETKTRYDYKTRDMVKVIRIEKIDVYDGKNPGQARTKFTIRTQSTPQYYPYYTKKDSRGRSRKRQLKYRHYYQVIVQLDKLSINVPFRGRVGALGKWDFSPRGRSQRIKGKVIEGTNIQRGLNGDFFFRCSYVWKNNGILFGRDWTNGQPPVRVNKREIVFAPKHMIACIEYLMNTGKLK